VKITGSGQTLGATVENLDLAAPLSRETVDALLRALGEYGVLRFPHQTLSSRQLADFSACFGTLEINVANAYQDPGVPEVMVLSNIVENGKSIGLADAGQDWHTDMSYSRIADQVAAKKLKVLAIGTSAPRPDFPGVPAMAQAGFPGFEETAPWVGLLAPAGTPTTAIERLSVEMRKSLARPQTEERMKGLGAVTIADTPAEFAAFLKKDHERWARVIKASGVKLE